MFFYSSATAPDGSSRYVTVPAAPYGSALSHAAPAINPPADTSAPWSTTSTRGRPSGHNNTPATTRTASTNVNGM